MRSLLPTDNPNPKILNPISSGGSIYSGLSLTRSKNSLASISSSEILKSKERPGRIIMRWKNRGGPTEFLSEKTFLVIKDNLNVNFESGGPRRAVESTRDNFCVKKNVGEMINSDNDGRSRHKSATPNADTWPPKLKKITAASCSSSSTSTSSLERPKTANLDEPIFLDPRLVDKLDMSMLSKELLLDSMTHIKLVNGGVGVGTIERRRQSLNIPSCPGAHAASAAVIRRESNRLILRTSGTRLVRNSDRLQGSNSGIISLARQKRKSFEPVTDSETYSPRDASPEVRSAMKKQGGKNKKNILGSSETIFKRSNCTEGRIPVRDDNNNKRSSTAAGNLTPKISALTIAKKKSSKITSIKSDVEVFTGANKIAPEPCKTCGRSDQPERFHSHPKNGIVMVKVRDNSAPISGNNKTTKIAIPKTVQKPVALNFRSEKRKGNKNEANFKTIGSPGTQGTKNGQNLQDMQTRNINEKSNLANSSPKRGPRSVTCYICSREFGTASFPIHEPKCLQKWERENNALPSSQRRSAPPQRPEVLPGHQGWNKAAWEQSQAQLLPCCRCGRTFLPDRLPVHERSCKTQRKKDEPSEEQRTRPERSLGGGGGVAVAGVGSGACIPVPRESPMVYCEICGRSFGSRSIKIHEPQCLKRWQAENEGKQNPAANSLSQNNQRKNNAKDHIQHPANPSSANSSTPQQDIPLPHKKTVPCYICGREFGSSSIRIHEPQCLRKWHQENDKLPSEQRRQQPEKPEIVFTRDERTGAKVIDHAATAEANWQSHLGQLVPCKMCGRTFNPDRVAVHERGCKGKR